MKEMKKFLGFHWSDWIFPIQSMFLWTIYIIALCLDPFMLLISWIFFTGFITVHSIFCICILRKDFR